MNELPPFSTLPIEAVAGILGQRRAFARLRQKGDELFDIRAPEMAAVNSYEDFLSLLVRCIVREAARTPQEEAGDSAGAASLHSRRDVNELTRALDLYIREWMFGKSFDPLSAAGWRMLLLPPLTAHIVRLFSSVLPAAMNEESAQAAQTAPISSGR